MGSARFYHLTNGPVEQTLPKLLGKALEAGVRVEVRAPDPARLAWLDEVLWGGDEAGFLPHGLAGGAYDALQPVLLTVAEATAPQTRCLMCIDGAPVDPEEAAQLDRVFVLFDGNDPAALAHARGQWKVLTSAGVAAEYWSEESGRWEMKSQSPARA